MFNYRNIFIAFSCTWFMIPSLAFSQTNDRLIFVGKTGFRFEKTNWSIAENLEGGSPNIRSELKWTDLVIADFTIASRYKFTPDLSMEVAGSFGKTLSGNVSDIDYLGDNRTNPSYQLQIKNKKGSDHSFYAHVAYAFHPSPYFDILPLLGYKLSSHSYWLPDDGIEQAGMKLNSSYKTNWKGPYAGVNLVYRPLERLSLQTNIQYHQIDYDAEGNWNLMMQFAHPKSFEHSAKGYQVYGSIVPIWTINKNISLLMDLGYHYAHTADGNDLAFMADGTQGYTRLNAVTRSYWQGRIGVIFNFLEI